MADSKRDKRHTLAVVVAFATIYLAWGTTYLGIAIAVETIPPFFMAGARFLFAGALLFSVLRLRGVPLPRRVQWRSALIVGGFLLLGGNGLMTWSEQEVPSSTASLVIATVPLWIALFGWLLFKGPRPGKQVTLGLLLGLAGIVLLIGPGQVLGTAEFSRLALLVILCAPLLWSIGSLYARDAELPDNSFMSTAMEMMAGGGLLLLASLFTGEAVRVDPALFSARSLWAMAYLTLVGSIIGFSAYIWLLDNVEPIKVATYSYVNPVIAVFLGWRILDEPVTPLTLAAVAAIVVAVILITTGGPRKTAVPAAESTPAPARSVSPSKLPVK